MDNGNSLLTSEVTSVDEYSDRAYSDTEISPNENGLSKVAIGMLIGATIGGIVSALTSKSVVARVNQTIKGVGSSVERTAISFNATVKEVGNAVSSVVSSVNETVRDVGSTVTNAAQEVNDTVEATVTQVRDTTKDVNDTMKTTVDAIQNTVTTIKATGEQVRPRKTAKADEGVVDSPSKETLYRLVPVAQEQTDE